MKTKSYRLLSVLLAAVMMVALSVSVMAAQSNAVTKDGLSAQLFTDKDSYQAGETVQASVQVENHTDREVFVWAQINVPESVQLAGDTNTFDAVLQDGESFDTAGGGITQISGGIPSTAGSSTATGDHMQAGLWIILTILAVCGIIALFVYGKNKKTWLSIMLCMAMVAGMVVYAVPAEAADMNGDIYLDCVIQVDGKDATVAAQVSYVIYDDAEEAKEPVVTEAPTEAPSETALPVETESPAPTETPAATEAPSDKDSDTDSEATPAPEPTKEPILTSTLWYDSVMFMTKEEQTEVDAIMSGVLAMHKGSLKAYYDNEKLDMPIAPVELDMEMYVPLSFTAETLGAEYAWDASANTVTLTVNGQATTLTVGSDVQLVDNELYIAPVKMAEMLNIPYFVHYGLVVFGKDSASFDAASDRVQNEVLSMVRYVRPAGQQLYNDLVANFEEGEHPRIHATAEDFTRIRGLVETDSFMQKCFANLQNRADNLLEKEPFVYDMNEGSQSLNNIDDSAERIELLAMAYQITGDTKYADRAWEEMETLCKYPDWNPYHFLDIGKIMSGVAVGFDWLYDYMNESQRELVKNAMLTKGLQECYWAYIGTPSEAGDHSDTWWIYREYNWSANINDAVLLALVAIYDEEFEGNELEEMLIPSFELALRSLEIHFNEWDPDGGWEEGPGYCADTLIFDAEILSLLETAMGTDYGIAAATNITAGAYYMLYQHAPAGDFNYGDAIEKTATDYDYEFYLARVYQDKSLGYERKSALEAGNTYECMPFELIWYDPQWVGDKIEGLNLDKYFREIELVTMRSDWNEDGMFAGFLSGNNNLTHSHLDTGTFILDWAGTRWATELGKDQASYESGGKNYVVYRKRAEGQNTLVIDDLPYTNPSGSRGDDQLREEGCVITRYESKKQGALAVTDMTKAYDTWASSAVRGVMLTDNRSAFVVRDEVTLKSKADVYWFAHTKLENTIVVSDDKKSAVMTDPNGNRMWVGILSEEGTFEVRDCTPLPGSPNPTQADNSATFHKLTIKFEGVTAMDATVAYIPLPRDTSVTEPSSLANIKALCAGNIADWQLPDGEIPSVDSLTVGGVEIEGFEPTKTSYTVTIRDDRFVDGNIPPVVAIKDGAELAVTQATLDKPTATFVVTQEDGTSATFTINFIVKNIIRKVVQGYEITEDDLTVSSIPQPDIAHPRMVLDGDLTTRWSSQNPGNYIILDFGEVKSFTQLDLAMNSQSITRTYQLEILVSADDDKYDDSKYTSVYKGPDLDAFDADGNQLGTVNYDFGGTYQARYIKIMLNGWDAPAGAQNWNNIAEIGGGGIDPLPPAPEITEAAERYILGSNTAVTIKTTGDLEKLEGVKLNGEMVEDTNYTKAESEDGTTIITFKAEYLETFLEGEYTVTLLYNDKTYVKTTLTVIDTRPVTIVLRKYGAAEGAEGVRGTNTVAIEAEDVIMDDTGMEVKAGETDVNGASASGNKIANAKTTQSITGVPDTLDAAFNPDMGFEITPDRTKTYYVWARVYRSTNTSTSARYMYVSLAGEDYTVKNIQNDVGFKTYTWILLGSVSGEANESVNVRLVPRQGGLWYDKFLVTTDGTLTGKEDVFNIVVEAEPTLV